MTRRVDRRRLLAWTGPAAGAAPFLSAETAQATDAVTGVAPSGDTGG